MNWETMETSRSSEGMELQLSLVHSQFRDQKTYKPWSQEDQARCHFSLSACVSSLIILSAEAQVSILEISGLC